jgi:hypothetical protein
MQHEGRHAEDLPAAAGEPLPRLGELGVAVEDGHLVLNPILLRRGEFLQQACRWDYVDLDGRTCQVALGAGTLAFTFCQVPIIYEAVSAPPRLIITRADGAEKIVAGNRLGREESQAVFNRTGEIRGIRAEIPAGTMLLA